MRHGGGIAYAKNNLNMEMFKKLASKTEFSPKITKDISVGGDVRIVHADHQVSGETNFNSFLAMQGDLYVNAKLNEILNIFITSGIDIPGISTEYEVYGMLSNLPANLYFKAGRYSPDYGIRIVEHRAFQRSFNYGLWNAPYDANTGFELGVSPEWFSINAGIFNPVNPNIQSQDEFLTGDPHKMIVGNTDFNFGFNDNKFNVNFGASFYNNPYKINDTTNGNSKGWGGHIMVGIMKRVALLGEIDFFERKTTTTALSRRMFSFGELNVIVIKGLELRGQFERLVRDRNKSDESIKRYSVGFAAFPFFGFETEVMIRFVSEEPKVDNDEYQWTFHFYF